MGVNQLSLVELTKIYGADFEQWFAGSKVKDRRHRPLVCIHGTIRAHSGAHALMHFGTPHAAEQRLRVMSTMSDLTAVRDYNAERRRHRRSLPFRRLYHLYPCGANLIPAYLRICRPYIMDRDPTTISIEGMVSISGIDEDHLGLCLGFGMSEIAIREAIRTHGDGETVVRVAMNKMGYDGVRYPNHYEDHDRRSWIVRDPDQVWFILG